MEHTIIRRGSIRSFSHDSISLDPLSTILKRVTSGIISDFEENDTINDIYLIVNAIDGLEEGHIFTTGRKTCLRFYNKEIYVTYWVI